RPVGRTGERPVIACVRSTIVDPTTQALLFALLGAVLGGGVVFAWRVSDAQQTRPAPTAEPVLPAGVAATLAVLRSSALVVDEADAVLKASAPAYAMGLVRNDRLTVDDLVDLV